MKAGFWHVIAYDDDGRVKFNAVVRDKVRTQAEINSWGQNQALLHDWSAFTTTFIS